MANLLKLSQFSYGEFVLTKLRRRRQRQRQKAIVLVSKTTTLHMHHAFFVHSLAVRSRLPRKMTKFYFFFFFFFI